MRDADRFQKAYDQGRSGGRAGERVDMSNPIQREAYLQGATDSARHEYDPTKYHERPPVPILAKFVLGVGVILALWYLGPGIYQGWVKAGRERETRRAQRLEEAYAPQRQKAAAAATQEQQRRIAESTAAAQKTSEAYGKPYDPEELGQAQARLQELREKMKEPCSKAASGADEPGAAEYCFRYQKEATQIEVRLAATQSHDEREAEAEQVPQPSAPQGDNPAATSGAAAAGIPLPPAQ